ncbi:MAG: PadR family transcriptional regulator [Myxococcota bacterium]
MTDATRILLHLTKGDDYALGIVKATGITVPYATLRRLEADGLVYSIQGETTEARRGRSRIYYGLTTAGWAAVLDRRKSVVVNGTLYLVRVDGLYTIHGRRFRDPQPDEASNRALCCWIVFDPRDPTGPFQGGPVLRLDSEVEVLGSVDESTRGGS